MKALIQLLLIVAVYFGTVRVQKYQDDNKPKTPAKEVVEYIPVVEVVVAKSGLHDLYVSAEGSIAAPARLSLAPEVPGRLVKLGPGFLEGAQLAEGDLLIEIDPADYVLARAAAKAQLQAVEAALTLELTLAKAATADWRQLNQGEVPALVSHAPQIAAAKAQVALAQVSLSQADLMLTRTMITMPFAGRIVAKLVEVGQRVDPAMAIAIIERDGDLEVRLSLELAELNLLNLTAGGQGAAGIPVVLETEIGGQVMRWTATGSRTTADLSPTNPIVTLIATIDKTEVMPPAGLFVRAQIQGRQVTALKLPRRSLAVDGQVMVVSPSGKLSRRQVEVLQTTAHFVLLSAGVEAGEQIVTVPPPVVIDNMDVRVAQGN